MKNPSQLDDLRYKFGSNWQSYIDTAFSPERLQHAIDSMQYMLGKHDLTGCRFLDIGCGSGIFSLAANMLGAEYVESFDYDQNSVQATLAIRQRCGIAVEKWHIQQGSVLDSQFMQTIGMADVVYSWGVLHHTGSMWAAIQAAAQKVQPGGVFALSIYNEVHNPIMTSARWLKLKRFYNQAPTLVQRGLEALYAAAFVAVDVAKFHNPLTTIQRYNRDEQRGMDFWHDVRDWLGGYPYEYANPGAVFTFLHKKMGFELIYLNTSYGSGCNEFTFRRPV